MPLPFQNLETREARARLATELVSLYHDSRTSRLASIHARILDMIKRRTANLDPQMQQGICDQVTAHLPTMKNAERRALVFTSAVTYILNLETQVRPPPKGEAGGRTPDPLGSPPAQP